ncbi:MAG: glycosyltransferase family A protein [Gracilimonas sp.]
MEGNYLITVVIPSYNRPELLERAVNSVLDQTYSNIEIIIVDDASDTEVGLVFEKDEKVKLLRNNQNKGPCYSRNRGLKEAKGEFINFLDDDDILFPEKIEKQLSCFENSDDNFLGMVTCHSMDQRSGKEQVKYNRIKGNIYKDLLGSFLVSGIETLLFRTEAVKEAGGFDEALESSHEYDLLIRISEFYTIDYVDEVLSKEYRSLNQISINFSKKKQGARYLYAKNSDRYRKIGFIFWLKMQIKLRLLLFRFYIGKVFGEKAYRLLIFRN